MKKRLLFFAMCVTLVMLSWGCGNGSDASQTTGETAVEGQEEDVTPDDVDTSEHKQWFEEEKIYLAISPSSAFGSGEDYVIVLSNDGEIETFLGTGDRECEEIEINGEKLNMEIEKQESSHLESSDLEDISDLLVSIKDNQKENKKGKKKYYDDAWEYILWIGNNKYYRYPGDGKNDTVKELMQMLMKVSPIEVNLHGFA